MPEGEEQVDEKLSEPVGDGEYVVEQGECVESIAADNGLFWETIWNDGANSAVKEARKDPNMLLPGDKLHVRPIEVKKETGETEKKHTFVRKGVPSALHLQFMDSGQPMKDLDYRLVLGDQEFKGKTDSRGRISHSVPPGLPRGALYLGTDPVEEFELVLRGLDPVDTATGIQARLRNLNYYEGDIDGDIGPRTRAAIRMFQQVNDLDPDGIAGPKTQAKLKEIHGA